MFGIPLELLTEFGTFGGVIVIAIGLFRVERRLFRVELELEKLVK